jgi:putative hydrolase of HD superfamily
MMQYTVCTRRGTTFHWSSDMQAKSLIALMKTAEHLKNNTRHSWTSTGRHESVAEHSWRLALLALFMRDEFPDADIDKVIRMCLIHDMGEAFTGDIPAFHKKASHEAAEAVAYQGWLDSLPPPYREDLTRLWQEMEAQQSTEARLYKALDKMETLMQHNEADIGTWLPIEHELNLTYGTEQVAFSSWLKELKEAINQDSRDKMNAAGVS